MAEAINRLNSALPLFLSSITKSKFSDKKTIGLSEWSLPQAWQAEFGLDGYVMSLFPKMCLIKACKAIVRNNPVPEKKCSDNNKNSRYGPTKSENISSLKKTLMHCTVHGHNATLDSSECYAHKN
jgi:hypothetical protein